MLSISLPRIFEDQCSGYPLRVSKVTLKWTCPVKILTMGQIGSSLMVILVFQWQDLFVNFFKITKRVLSSKVNKQNQAAKKTNKNQNCWRIAQFMMWGCCIYIGHYCFVTNDKFIKK